MTSIRKKHWIACFLFFSIIFTAIMHAAEVSENEILAAARKWIADNAMFQADLPNAVPEKAVQMADFEGKPMPLWRVDLQPTGYLVMSADDTLPPVVAFGTKSSFDMPPAHPLPAMLNRQGEIFQDELKKPKTRGNELAAENLSRWNALLGRTRAESVTPSKIITEPLVTTIWDQSAPYDYICPTDGRYLHRGITGCVPTAFSQILKFHEWPPRGEGSISYTDDQGNVKGELRADYSFPYEWDLMRDDQTDNWHNYTFAYPERNIDRSDWAVARMMMEMGACAQVDYEEDATGGYSYYFQFLVTSNLWYKDTVEYGDTRSQYIGYVPQETLYTRIREDMVAGRPSILTYTGHAFVGDGLGTMGGLDYYHINYGWSGYHNGWYLLTDGYKSTVIVSATTGIEPRPVAMFKPMSVEQPAAFTLEWDFPKRLKAEAFRLTKITGDHSFVVSSTIDGTARSFNVSGQSGTATYTLEAMIGGNWQEVSEGVTVTVKANPTPMLELMVDDELNSVAGRPFSTLVVANNTLKSLSVSCSRPDMLANSSISVTGSGISRTIRLTPNKNLAGNAVLYLTGVDTAGNTAKKTVLLRVLENEVVWQTSYIDAFTNALLKGKMVLLVVGREKDASTASFLNKVCEDEDIKANLLANFELWFSDVDISSDHEYYVSDLGYTFPCFAIFDPSAPEKSLRSHAGPMTVAEASLFLDTLLPYFSLQDEILAAGRTHDLELSVLDRNAEIRYRLDGKEPTANDTLYVLPIPLSAPTTVSARAFKYGLPVSDTVTKSYTFLPQVATPILNVEGQKYFSDLFLVTAYCSTTGATVRYTTDGTIPTATSPVFPAGDLLVTENTSLAVRAFMNGMKPSECVSCVLYNVGDVIKGDGVEIDGEETDWFLQKKTYNSAPSAMQSKAIGDYDVSTMAVKAMGSGTIKFHWKVSCEADYDYLAFYIDNELKAMITGNTNWAQKTFSITGDGEHTLVWCYIKDVWNAEGSDCGWVDDIVWTPTVGKTLVSININGSASIASGDTETYVCMAKWNDGTTSPVTPTWNLSSSQYANLSNGKVTNKNTTEKEQTVTLNATYTSGGVTKTASKSITLAKRGVASIVIMGDASIANGARANYVCKATWSDGETKNIKPEWSLSSTQYASVDADGNVTNRNTTDKDQSVTLTATYTSDGVTKTVSVVITLLKRTLVSISITGDSEIAGGETSPYVCTAIWSDGTAISVMPTWSLSSTQHASVDASGNVTNRNATDKDQTVTLNASYTSGGVVVTASKNIKLTNRYFLSISIDGDNVISSGATASFTCVATWSDGAMTTVQPTWTLSSFQYASLDEDGKVTNKNATDTDQTVTLNASFTSGGTTKTDSRVITLARRTLKDITVNGDEKVVNFGTATYVCTAWWSVGEPTEVAAQWQLSSTDYATVDEDGKVTNQNVTDTDQKVTLTANYIHVGVMKTASKDITLEKRYLSSVAIEGDSIIPKGAMATYTCTAIWSDGATSAVTASWSLSDTQYATVSSTGKVVNKNTLETDQTVTLNASYTVDGVTKTASKAITLTNRSLVSISISGDSVIPSAAEASYECTATWSDGATSKVSPTWKISTNTAAVVDMAGKVLNKNATDTNQTVTLTAVCQAGAVTKTATKDITLKKRIFESISIKGDNAIPAGDTASYVCIANWSVGEPTVVTAAWSLSSMTYAYVDTLGKLMNRNTTEDDQTVMLTASHTHDGVTKTDSKTIVLTKRLLLDITITGNATIGSGTSVTYVCDASWSDGSTTAVKAVWSLDSTEFAAVDANGKVMNKNTTADDQKVTLTATFTSGGETKTESKAITLAKRTLAELSILGDNAISNGFTSAYECKAIWSDGTTTRVTPKWSLTSTLHASLDSTGRVTNKNTTSENQTVTLVADFQSGDVTKTATKSITMVKRTLKSIAINGVATIASGEASSYSCIATWSDDTTSEVMAEWSLDSTEFAVLEAGGRVVNKNTTDTDATVALTATFAYGDVTKTAFRSIRLVKRTLLSIAIAGDDAIPNAGFATYSCTPTWSDGATDPVTPAWSLSSTQYASVDAEGKVMNLNTTDTDQTVKLTASYTFAGATRTATMTIKLAKRTIVSIAVDGKATIPNNMTETYSCTATWSDGTTAAVSPTWSLSSTRYSSLAAGGKVTNQNTSTAEQTVTLTASYTFGGVTLTAEKTIALTQKAVESIAINGKSNIAGGMTASYACVATWSDGNTSNITPVWSLSSTEHASVTVTGKVTNQNSTATVQEVTLIATYVVGDKTYTNEKVITLASRSLNGITIEGEAAVATKSSATYVCKATWNVGDPTSVSPVWSLSSNEYASVDANGKVTNKNMTMEDQTVALTAVFTVGDVTKTASIDITLKRVSELVQILELLPGWNFVTLTKQLKNNPDGVQKFLALKPMMLSADNGAIVMCGDGASLKAGIGYWVYSRSRQLVEFVQDTETPVSQVNLKHGWNFVGMTEDAAWPDSATAIWTWRNGRFIPVEKEDLRVGCSYWVYIN